MSHATFSTALGTCAIAWNDVGLTRFLLPGDRAAAPEAEAVPPAWVQDVIERVRRHLAGEAQDFSDLRYDFSGVPAFNRRVLEATLAVKSGHTATYGQIAANIGESSVASRAVGTALGTNPWPLLIPCHRILSATGKMTGFSGPGGVATKSKLLALEGAQLL